jgi:hypothetical protein
MDTAVILGLFNEVISTAELKSVKRDKRVKVKGKVPVLN